MVEVKSKCSSVAAPIEKPTFSKWTLDLHDEFNLERFASEIDIADGFEPLVKVVYDAFNQPQPTIHSHPITVNSTTSSNNKVVLGLSGGLDSTSQMLSLIENGMEVVPFTMRHANYASSARELSACQSICEKLGVELKVATFNKGKKDNPHHKHWMENPIKNQMIMGFMLDFAIENGIGSISLGENGTTHVGVDAVPGINLTDAVEVNNAWLDGVRRHCQVNFIPMDSGLNKLEQLKLVMKHGLENDFFSCLAGQRMNGKMHDMNQSKYGVELWRSSCGCSCRKCAQMNLLLHYNGKMTFPVAFVDACWRKLKSDKQVGPLFNVDETTSLKNLLGTY
jgi:hypothetical protein